MVTADWLDQLDNPGRIAAVPRGGRGRPGMGALYGGVVPTAPSAPKTVDALPADLIDLYSARTAERVCGLRSVIHEHRAASPLTLGVSCARPAATDIFHTEVVAVGRGTADHRIAVQRDRAARRRRYAAPQPAPLDVRPPVTPHLRPLPERAPRPFFPIGSRRKVAAAVIGAVIIILGAAGSTMAQQRYQVQPGDTLSSVASTFGVDPDAILAASYLPDGPDLSPGQIIVLPDPGQDPSQAAEMAALLEGTSPWVVGAHIVQPGDTLSGIAAVWGLDAATLANFNGVADPENLMIGDRILIPQTPQGWPDPDAVVSRPGGSGELRSAGGTFVSNVPTYVQSRNLSCEYAASFIATSVFNAGVPESVFLERIPVTLNPHYGFRGDIDGPWGGTDDYGIYPEALAPILNEYGFNTEIFYSDGATGQLTAHIDAGQPVLVWLGLWGDTAVTLTDDGTYTVAAGDHVVVVYGYDSDGVFVSDPATGTYKTFTWDDFLAKWTVLDGMAMAVSPY